ncbi:MAG: NAD(+)/NADH kinase [Kiritimatiellia bacterium]|jgi:NAD+ kinase
MKRIGILVNRIKPNALEAATLAGECATARGMALFGTPEDLALVRTGTPCEPRDFAASGVEAVVCIGGDGAMLRAAHALHGSNLPLAGVNIGHLGYLTAAQVPQLDALFDALLADTVLHSPRTMLAGRCLRADGSVDELPDALNEFVLSRGAGLHLEKIAVDIDGHSVTTFACDGIIVSTPTGSTAYSLSAGGPVILPEAGVFALSVICPHALGARPLVFSEDSAIGLRALRATRERPAVASVDGHNVLHLEDGDRLELRRSPRTVDILHLPGHDRFLVLSEKLGWGGRREPPSDNDPASIHPADA